LFDIAVNINKQNVLHLIFCPCFMSLLY